MKKWSELSHKKRASYKEGRVKIQCFIYDCRYKFISEDDIEFYFKGTGNDYPHYTHYKSLVAYS